MSDVPHLSRCRNCGRGVSMYSDEVREWLWIEDDEGAVRSLLCLDCQSPEDRRDVVELIRKAIAERTGTRGAD